MSQSRWDVLRPADKGPSRTSRDLPTNGSFSRRRPRITHNDNSKVTVINGCKSNDSLCVTNISNGIPKQQLYVKLRQDYLANPSVEALIALADEVRSSYHALSAEQAVQETVFEIFLSYLSSLELEEEKTWSATRIKSIEAILKTLQELLSDPTFASSMLAPILDQVTADGKESQLTNPIRARLFQTLESLLSTTVELPSVNKHVCVTLTKALTVTRQRDKTKYHANLSFDVRPTAILSYIQQQLLDSKMAVPVLELLLSFVRRHPDASSTLVIPLLEEYQPAKAPCVRCGSSEGSLLLSLLHTSQSNESTVLAMSCITELLRHAPWELWLRRNTRPTHGQPIHAVPSTGRFPDRCIACLEHTLQAALCCLSNAKLKRCTVLASFLSTVLVRLPYDDDDSGSLLILSIPIVSTLMDWSVPIDDTATLPSGTTVQANTRLPSQDTQRMAVDIMVEASGGRVTPQGETTPTSRPLQAWLKTASGRAWCQAALERLHDNETNSNSNPIHKLLLAILRSNAHIVTSDQDMATAFEQAIQSLCSCERRQLVGFSLLEALLKGRNASPSKPSFFSIRPFGLLLRQGLACAHVSTQSGIASCYGYLQSEDWMLLDASGESGTASHIRPLLALSLDCNRPAKFRSDICKAIGDICTNYFASNLKDSKLVCDELSTTMLQASRDANTAVRLMSLYALGNLAQSVNDVTGTLLSNETLLDFAKRLLECLQDPDEKVMGNAIRSLGHVMALVVKRVTTDERSLLEAETLASLTRIIRAALALCHDGSLLSATSKLSWKQRQAIKKHGWGACNSLTRLFEAGIARQELIEMQDAVNVLLDCVTVLLPSQQQAEPTVVKEKLVCSASAALCSLDADDLVRVVERIDTPGVANEDGAAFGSCMASCLVFLQGQQQYTRGHNGYASQMPTGKPRKLLQEAERLFGHLIHCATIPDAVRLLHAMSQTPEALSFLYSWMEGHHCAPASFATFVLAMQQRELAMDDVDLEVRFMIHATAWQGDEDTQDEI